MTDDKLTGPLDHIGRVVLPWRTEATLTECGKQIDKVHGNVITRDEARARINRIGKTRASFTLCMTCVSTSDRYHAGHVVNDAVAAVARETASAMRGMPPRRTADSERWHARDTELWQQREHLNAELEAVAALVRAHRDEFDGYLASRAETVSLADRRRQRRG